MTDGYALTPPKPPDTNTLGERILMYAETAAGLPYALGGRSCGGATADVSMEEQPPRGHVGFDCSGLLSWAVCAITGRDLFAENLRNTADMYCEQESILKYKYVSLSFPISPFPSSY